MEQRRRAPEAPGSAAEAGGPAPPSPGGARPLPPPPALARRFERHLRRTRLIAPGQTVVVAVSGGVDSVALLHLLRFLPPSWGLRLIAAHFDHRMRAGSGADADWVAGLCLAWQIPLVRGEAAAPPRSEAAARDARYRFLRAVRRRTGADRVATAHHADDQAETVLFRAIRGAGLRGLAAIPPRRGPLVRPLLPFRRAEIEAYAAAARVRFREDPTNREPGYARNRIRHEVLPVLERIAPGAARSLARLADHARAAERAWDHVIGRLTHQAVLARRNTEIELARPVLLSYDPPVRARVIRRVLRRLGVTPGRRGTTAAVEFTNSGASGAAIRLAGGIRIEREFDRIRIRRAPREAGPPAAERPAVIPGPETGEAEAVIGGRRYAVRWTAARGPRPAEGEAFGLGDLRFPLVVRGWMPGDRIRLRYGTKKLKKLFGEKRVGRTARAGVPVLAEAGGRVLWVKGVARAAVAQADPGRPNLHVTVSDAELG